jgi:hypothetical protein
MLSYTHLEEMSVVYEISKTSLVKVFRKTVRYLSRKIYCTIPIKINQ